MILPMAAAALLVLATASIAIAQRRVPPPLGEPKLPFPAEKFSPRPVQPARNDGSFDPVGFDKDQKWRWDGRTRAPAGEPK